MANIIKNGSLTHLGIVDVVRHGIARSVNPINRMALMNEVLHGYYMESATVLDITHCAIKVRFSRTGHDEWVPLRDVVQHEREESGNIKLSVFQRGIARFEYARIAEKRFDTPAECLAAEQEVLGLGHQDIFTHVEVWDNELVLTDEEGNEEAGDWTDWRDEDFDSWDDYKFAVAGVPLPSFKKQKE
jgi:hypothetical protein